jgi:hypothetical protein
MVLTGLDVMNHRFTIHHPGAGIQRVRPLNGSSRAIARDNKGPVAPHVAGSS